MMRRRIYFAGPLHREEDRRRNEKLVAALRMHGHNVYLPQEHGVWEDLVGDMGDEDTVRKLLYGMDMDAMRMCDTCIVCCGDAADPRAPSEGAMFEMGWMKAANKTVLLYNEKNYWHYNLMPQFGADMVFDDWDSLIKFLAMQGEEVPPISFSTENPPMGKGNA